MVLYTHIKTSLFCTNFEKYYSSVPNTFLMCFLQNLVITITVHNIELNYNSMSFRHLCTYIDIKSIFKCIHHISIINIMWMIGRKS